MIINILLVVLCLVAIVFIAVDLYVQHLYYNIWLVEPFDEVRRKKMNRARVFLNHLSGPAYGIVIIVFSLTTLVLRLIFFRGV